MKRKFLNAIIITGAIEFTACQEDSTMNELADEIELNLTTDPDDDDKDGPGSGAGNN